MEFIYILKVKELYNSLDETTHLLKKILRGTTCIEGSKEIEIPPDEDKFKIYDKKLWLVHLKNMQFWNSK